MDRVTDGRGPVDDFTLAELRALDASGHFGPEHGRQRILALEEALQEFPDLPFVLELKDPRAVAPTVRLLRARGWVGRVQVTSFHWGALLDALSLERRLSAGFLCPALDPDLARRAVRRGIAQLCPPAKGLAAKAVAEVRALGLQVRAYGVHEPADARRALDAGVDGMTADDPAALLRLLAERGWGAASPEDWLRAIVPPAGLQPSMEPAPSAGGQGRWAAW
ncbi:glycerophosphodiester phosphodiesterase [Limnochorda pilosa]|uniref:Glycerophosphodiester phosphodiesterase n=1 Tax=Limnochorda pilosa TaxID=1555112 RepID=A0A0K2SH10_LIMPI|nr:glycerophosphodiester phosphodiesterase family protein [Limnochorda pilosa]BAS26317.1 glycerophosphodiester phosphodiesterase [Limnochorda pilosa]